MIARALRVAFVGIAVSGCVLLPPHSADVERSLWTLDECPEIGLHPEKNQQNASAAGAEDIAIDHVAKVAYVSTTDRRGIMSGKLSDKETRAGYIYRINLDDRPLKLIDVTPKELQTKEFRPHGISLYRDGDKPMLFVIDHPPTPGKPRSMCGAPSKVHMLTARDPNGPLAVERSTTDSLANMPNPNDIAAVDSNRFYVTNTFGTYECHGRFTEPLFGSHGFVGYYDGEKIEPLKETIPIPNGIAVDRASRRLYVSSLMDGGIRVFQLDDKYEAGQLVTTIWTGGRLDNIDLTGDGSLLVTSHPSTILFLLHSFFKSVRAPSRVYRVAPGETPKVSMIYDDPDDVPLSAASTAALYRDTARAETLMLLGTVYDPKPRVCMVTPTGGKSG